MSVISFYSLVVTATTKEGARPLFERLVAQLVRIVHGTVRRLEANPGDWGIDVFLGQLTEGSVYVWQSKFFIDGVGNTQKQEIRDSFNRCVAAALDEEHRLESWTLCIPVSMDPAATQWWERWKRKKEKEHDISIELWDATELEGLLLAPDAHALRDAYFGDAADRRQPRALEDVPDGEAFEHMLFVKQLRAARIAELDAAKTEFFNAELLTREIGDKGDHAEIVYLNTVRTETHSLWSRCYNEHCSAPPADPLLPGFHSDVMANLEQHHRHEPDGPVPLNVVHRFGAMHQVVETGKAGWIKDYRTIVDGHTRQSSSDE